MESESSNPITKKKITVLATLIVTLLMGTISATYAYFAISATNNDVITGTSAMVNSELIVTPVLPAEGSQNSGVMVPQYSANPDRSTNALKTAIDGGCVDGNSNIVCQVYKIQYKNGSGAAIRINSTLTLESQMSNLKWYTIATANNAATAPTTVTYTYPASFTTAYGNLKSTTTLGNSDVLNANSYRYWYVAIWIEEQGTDQYSVDGNKTFNGTVEVQATDAQGNEIRGLTSTFTG